MKKLIIVFMGLVLCQCSICKNKGDDYPVISKESKIVGYDKLFVKKVYFSSWTYDLNHDWITEQYSDQINIYLDSVNYGKKWPRKVEAFINKGSVVEKVDSSNIEIRNTVLGVGLFINKRFYGDETHLKMVLTKDDSTSNVILDFDLKQKSHKVYHSGCMDAFYKL
ncbi:hypothetical protein [Fibrobacter sp.]|uniref:hypothetical protein n=1 Tax=Fibrobacter sp. TaxID=35828 RepID=UPI0038645549